MNTLLQHPTNPICYNTWQRHVQHYLRQYNVRMDELIASVPDLHDTYYAQNKTTGGALEFVQGWMRDRGIVADKDFTLPPALPTEPTQEGLYLRLLHGRHEPNEELDGWGFDGPVIGPLKFAHTIYTNRLRYEFDGLETMGFLPTGEFEVVEDMLEVDGCYYGDWMVFYHRGTPT